MPQSRQLFAQWRWGAARVAQPHDVRATGHATRLQRDRAASAQRTAPPNSALPMQLILPDLSCLHLCRKAVTAQNAGQPIARAKQRYANALFSQIQDGSQLTMIVTFHVSQPEKRALPRFEFSEKTFHIRLEVRVWWRDLTKKKLQRPQPVEPPALPFVVDEPGGCTKQIGLELGFAQRRQWRPQQPQVSFLQKIVRAGHVSGNAPDVCLQRRRRAPVEGLKRSGVHGLDRRGDGLAILSIRKSRDHRRARHFICSVEANPSFATAGTKSPKIPENQFPEKRSACQSR